MKRALEILFLKFLERHHLKNQPLLLGLSGGPDSIALFYLMLKLSRNQSTSTPFTFGVAHIDHSWRPESANEAVMLKHLVEENAIPFFCKTLDPNLFNEQFKNKEDFCRTLRFNFFRKLCSERGYEGVVLGHHQDDQSETVLKRILEGSSFLNFTGMKPVTSLHGLKVIRPFLDVRKKEILNYLKSIDKVYLNDSTNKDQRYLRSRMRESIIPSLSRQFGKEISSNLTHLSNEIKELQLFLDQVFNHHSNKIVKTPTEYYLDLSEGVSPADFELKYIIRKFCDVVEMPLSRTQLQTLIPLVRNRKTGKTIIHGNKRLRICKCKIYFEHLQDQNRDHKLQTDNFAVDGQ